MNFNCSVLQTLSKQFTNFFLLFLQPKYDELFHHALALFTCVIVCFNYTFHLNLFSDEGCPVQM